jgi:hypothetical protein
MMSRAAAAVALAGLATVAACEHAQPFGRADLGPNQPFGFAFPRQLTFSRLGDVDPAFLPADSGIIYSLSLDRPDGDHCLGVMPAAGGHVTTTICHTGPFDADSTNALWMPAPGPMGLLAYLRDGSAIGATDPSSSELVLAPWGAPDPGRVLVRFPYTDSGGSLVTGIRDLQWWHAGTLVFRSGVLTFTTPPMPVDTLFSANEIVRLDLVGDSVQRTSVPNTAGATSVATDSLALYYTLPGDSRVYRLLEGAPTPTVWYDFGAAGAPTRIRVAGRVLAALVGDSIYDVHVGAGTTTVLGLPDSLQVVDIALSHAGDRLVAAASASGAPPDLWLLVVP